MCVYSVIIVHDSNAQAVTCIDSSSLGHKVTPCVQSAGYFHIHASQPPLYSGVDTNEDAFWLFAVAPFSHWWWGWEVPGKQTEGTYLFRFIHGTMDSLSRSAARGQVVTQMLNRITSSARKKVKNVSTTSQRVSVTHCHTNRQMPSNQQCTKNP